MSKDPVCEEPEELDIVTNHKRCMRVSKDPVCEEPEELDIVTNHKRCMRVSKDPVCEEPEELDIVTNHKRCMRVSKDPVCEEPEKLNIVTNYKRCMRVSQDPKEQRLTHSWFRHPSPILFLPQGYLPGDPSPSQHWSEGSRILPPPLYAQNMRVARPRHRSRNSCCSR